MFGRRRETFLSREIGKKWDRNREDPIYRKSQFLDGSRGIEDLTRGVHSKDSRWIEVAIEHPEGFSMDRNNYRELLRMR